MKFQAKNGALLLAIAAGFAQAQNLGQVIDNSPQPSCANVLPLTLEAPQQGNYVSIEEANGLPNNVGVRVAGSQGPFVARLEVPANTVIEVRPQLYRGGNMSDGGIALPSGYIDGKYLNSTARMSPATLRYYVGARRDLEDQASPWARHHFQFNGSMGLDTPSVLNAPLRSMNVVELESFPQYATGVPGGFQATVSFSPLEKGWNYISTDFYAIGQWQATVNGRQYCGKGLRHFSYVEYAVNVK